jgi:thiamine biosynthesis protein ThiS
MKITLNGYEREVAPSCSVADLIQELGLPCEQVAVERNRSLVKRTEQSSTQLVEGDTLEIVSLVGGG